MKLKTNYNLRDKAYYVDLEKNQINVLTITQVVSCQIYDERCNEIKWLTTYGLSSGEKFCDNDVNKLVFKTPEEAIKFLYPKEKVNMILKAYGIKNVEL